MAGSHGADLDARILVTHAFDVARAIDLAACAPLTTERVVGPRRREWPLLFGFDQRPLVWSLEPVELRLDGHALTVQPRAIIYDFGNVSVALRGEVHGPPEAWRDLAVALDDSNQTETVARDVMTRFTDLAAGALRDPRPPDDTERYTVFQLDAVPDGDAATWVRDNAPALAHALRAEAEPLCDGEIADAVGRRLTYTPGDAVVVDSHAALVIDREPDDILAVLDFASCERLALRVLDDDLDRAVFDATHVMRSRASRWRMLLSPWGRDVRRLTQLTFDASAELEAVENAIKLTGDDYLARVYRLALERFHLEPFHQGIGRKLSTLWSIQKVFIDQAATRRAEILETIIILLIAIEVVRALQ